MLSLSVDNRVRERAHRLGLSRLRARLGRMIEAAWLSEITGTCAAPVPFEVSVRLTDDGEIRALNRDFRSRDTPTDVLAFAMREADDEAPPGLAPGPEVSDIEVSDIDIPDIDIDIEIGPEALGDIVISIETAAAQAGRERRPGLDPDEEPVFAEVLFLAAHGLCHLLGYDHQNDDDEAVMNARMQDLLKESAQQGPVKAA